MDEKEQSKHSKQIYSQIKNSFSREDEIEKRARRIITILFGISILISIIIGRISYFYIQTVIEEQNPGTKTSQQKSTQNQEEGNIQYDPINHAAYVDDRQIVLFNKTSHIKQDIKDPELIGSYTALGWKNKYELTYSICENMLCSIRTYNISTNEFQSEIELEAIRITSVRWSHRGKELAYLYDNGENVLLDIKHQDKSSTLWTFPEVSLGSDFDASQYIRFSPDDSLLLVVNTAVYDTDSSIIIFHLEGEKLFDLKKVQGHAPTFPFFMSNELIYYKMGTKLYRLSLETKESQILTERIYNPLFISPSPDKSKITYYTYDPFSGMSTVWVYEIGTDTLTRLKDNTLYPLWLDDLVVVMQSVDVCHDCLVDEFETQGLTLMNTDSRLSEIIEKDGESNLVTCDNL